MRAVVCRAFGNPAAVRVETLPDPPVDGLDVRIGVCASGLSFANLLALEGRHQNRADLPFTPGTDVSTQQKADACRRHGADHVINHREQSFREAVLTLTDGRGADVVFDPVGGDVFAESLRCIAPDGRLISVGFASGTIPQLSANIPLVKNFDLIGLYWGYYLGWGRVASHPREEERVRAAMTEMFAWHAQGRLRPEIHGRYPLDDYLAALAALASREVIGRVVLNPLNEHDMVSSRPSCHRV